MNQGARPLKTVPSKGAGTIETLVALVEFADAAGASTKEGAASRRAYEDNGGRRRLKNRLRLNLACQSGHCPAVLFSRTPRHASLSI